VSKLHVADGLSFPAEFAGRRTAVFGISGSGKSNTATVLIEQLLHAGEQIVLIDPKGEGWGLLSLASGKPSDLPVVVFGEPNGHIETLAENHGPRLADFVVETGRSVVLSLLGFESDQSERRFVATFLRQLYRRKSRQGHATRTLVVLDEAHLFVPESSGRGFKGDAAEMAGAVQRIVRQGRSFGIGSLLVDQRPQDVSKRVVTQCDTLVCHQLVHNTDRDALREWVRGYDTGGRGQQFLDSLAALEPGEAWVWSPAWLKLFRRSRIHLRKTFDSGAAPDGSAAARSVQRAEVDLDALRGQLAEIVDKAKADDPRELRKKIADLERQLKARPAAERVVEKTVTVEVPVLKNGQLDRTEGIIGRLETVAEKALTEAGELRRLIAPAAAPRPAVSIPKLTPAAVKQAPAATPRPNVSMASSTAAAPPAGAQGVADGEPLSGPEQRILDALAWLESIGVREPDLAATAFLAGYTIGGGAFNNPRGRLRSRGLVDYLSGGRMVLTDAGRQAANVPDVPLTTDEMHRRVLSRLPGPEQKILQVLLEVYPNDIGRDELAERSGYSEGGGAFNNPCGRLRTLGLIDYPSKGRAVALPLLFVGH
jgi:uncharacterized protein